MGGCQSRDATMRYLTEFAAPSEAVRRRNDLSSNGSFKVGKEQTPPMKQRIKIIPDLDPPGEELCTSPCATTVAETLDDGSPSSSTLASLYFASPMQTVIPEEEDRDIPSDEEDSVYQMKEIPLDETAGTLLRKHTGIGSFQGHRSVIKLPESLPLSSETDNSVSHDALSHFKSLKLHVKMQNKANEKQRKQSKMEHRIEDVQTYRQLWSDYMDLQQEVSSIDSEQNAHSRQRSSGSFDLQETDSWFFDFNQADFGSEHCGGMSVDDDGSHCSQANLSLLSEQSLEAQRRYFKEKKNQKKKRKKYGKSKTSKSLSATRTGGSSVSSMGSRDYGPIRSTAQPGVYDETALQDMEVMVPDADTPNPICESDNASCVSDLGDESISSIYDYGVRRRQKRQTPTVTSSCSKSLRSKLDSLEDAVAGLSGSHSTPKDDTRHGTDKPRSGRSNYMQESLTIVDVAAASTDFGAEPQRNQMAASREVPVTAMQSPTRDGLASNSNESDTSDSKVERWQAEHLQAVQETSYTTGDESSVNSDFGDLRSSKGASILFLGNGKDSRESSLVSGTKDGKSGHLDDNVKYMSSFENSWDTPEKRTDALQHVPFAKQSRPGSFPNSLKRGKRKITGSQISAYLGYRNEENGEEGTKHLFRACSQTSRLIQKSKSNVQSLSTEEFLRLSFGDPLSSWDPYQNVGHQPSDEECDGDLTATGAPATKESDAENRRLMQDENLVSESPSSTRIIPLAKDSPFSDQVSMVLAESATPLDSLELVDKVAEQKSRVLFNLRQTNEKT